MVIDLRNGRLLPDHDKIAALKNKPIPQTKKQLKQFLGAIVFFSQLMPVAAQDLAVLNRATRGKNFKVDEESITAYENIQYLLSDANLLFVYRSDPEKRYYVTVDSSLFHTGWVIFQLCDRGHPRALSYNSKTWDQAFSNQIPAMRELMGILTAVYSIQRELEYAKGGVTLFTDSLPIVLCTVTRHNNSKIARFFMYLSSLSWLEISFAPGKSHLINIADYFSRKTSDAKMFSMKLPTKCDEQRCELLNKKLRTDRSFTAAKTCYVIDSLSRESEATLLDIQMGSYGISDHGDISYVSNSTGKEVVRPRKVGSKTSDLPLKALEKQPMDALNVRTVIMMMRRKMELTM